MMDKLLNLKAWQMFLLLVVPLFLQYRFPSIGIFMELIHSFIIVGWIFAVAMVAYHKLPERHDINITFFQVNCILFTGGSIMMNILYEDGYSYSSNDQSSSDIYDAFTVFGILYMLFAFLYINYFAAKMLCSVPKGKVVRFRDCFWDMMCFLVYPIGVWFVQPEVNKLADHVEQHHQ